MAVGRTSRRDARPRFSALHTLYALLVLMPKPLRPGLGLRAGLVLCAVFYIGISVIAFSHQWPKIRLWLGS